MVDPLTMRRWTYRLLFAAIASVVVFVRILPLDLTAGHIPGPDIVLLFALSWVLRRPDYVPVALVAAVFLLTDMLFMRPPGLWSALAVMAVEFLRSRAHVSRELPFLVEWMMVTAVLSAMILANRLILTVFLVSQPGFGQDVMLLLATALAYPLVVLFSATVLGVRKMAPGEVDQLGHRP